MNKKEYIENGLTRIGSTILDDRAENGPQDLERRIAILTSELLGAIHDAVNPDIELKLVRNNRAKQFPVMKIAKYGDVGFDLPAVFETDNEHVTIWPGDRGVIPTGIKIEIPEGYWASIEARSSTSKHGLIVPKGVIDEGYRGELFAVLLNVGHDKVRINHGDRLVQLILHKRHNVGLTVTEVEELSPSERGDTGFGSTGQRAEKSNDMILKTADVSYRESINTEE